MVLTAAHLTKYVQTNPFREVGGPKLYQLINQFHLYKFKPTQQST